MAPSSVLDRLVETSLAAGPVMLIAAGAIRLGLWAAAQVRGLHGLDVDRVVGAHQGQRRLVMEVAPLPPHVLMLFRVLPYGLRTALAALLAARDALLRLLQSFLRRTLVARVVDELPLRP